MKKLLFFVFVAILPAIAFSQYLSKEFTLDDSDVTTAVAINVPVSNADSVIILSDTSTASGLFVSGCANLANDDDSYVRITLKDTDSNEYLIYELYPILAEIGQCPFSKIGLESAYLDNIHPQSIRIETLNASVVLDSVYFVVPERSSRNMSKAISNRKSQCEHIANRMNERLIRGNKTWRAGVTFVSQMTFEEKKWLMGKTNPVLFGFDYYKGGVFVMPGFYQSNSQNFNKRDSDNYVTEWDWRNRHGKNWMTRVQDQDTCNACWAFSAVGTFESYINLYYNQLLNFDLSEQDVISWCKNDDCLEGGLISEALKHIKLEGVVPEQDFPYTATNCSFSHIIDDSKWIKIDNYSTDYYESYKDNHSNSYYAEEDSIKRMIFRSPICFGNRMWEHFFIVAGYKQIQSGEHYFTSENPEYPDTISHDDPLIGHPAWLFKNSFGTDWGENGYGYVVMSLQRAYGIHKLLGNVFCSDILNLSSDNILCVDADKDGYYNWGIGERPSTIPSWAPIEEDGDDSDWTKGPIDMYGRLQSIDPSESDTIEIDYYDDFTYTTPNAQYVTQHIKVFDEGELTISCHLFCRRGVSITIERGSTLIISECGYLENVIIKPQPGSHIVIEDGGHIKQNKDVNFKIPTGVTLEQNQGIIE